MCACLDHEDWVWWHETVPKKLAELHKDGYRLIIFTNQGGIEKQHTKLDDIKRKCEKLIEETNAPIFVFISTGESHYRKPATGMFDHFVENCNENVEVGVRRPVRAWLDSLRCVRSTRRRASTAATLPAE